MSLLPDNTCYTPSDYLLAGNYTASGGMATSPAWTTLPIANLSTEPILVLNENLMPEIGKSYFIQVSLFVDGVTGTFAAGAFMNIGLQYDTGFVSVSTLPDPGASVGLVNIADIFTRVASPGVPLRIIVGNNMGGTITAGNVRLNAVNVMEVPQPRVISDADIVAP